MKNISLKSVSMKSVSMAGKTDGEWFEGYPLEVLAKAKKTASAYTIFGNTNSSAKGVGTEIVQMCENKQTAIPTDFGVYNVSTSVVNGEITIKNTKGSSAVKCIKIDNGTGTSKYFPVGHKVLLLADLYRDTDGLRFWICYQASSGATLDNSRAMIDTTDSNGWKRCWSIYTISSSATALAIRMENGASLNTQVKAKNIQIIDLTALFGSGNEPTSVSDFLSRLGVSSLPSLPFGSTYHIGVVDGSKNLFDKDTAAVGFLVTDGSVVPPDHENLTSDFIPVTEGEIYTYSLFGNKSISLAFWTGWCFYDANKALIGTRIVSSTASFSLTVPSGAKYIRIGSRELSTLLNAQLERGATATAYSPYFSAKSALFLPCPLYLNETVTDKGKITKADGTTATAVSVGKIGVQKGDNVITADTEVKPTKIKAKI